jgi:ribokinase
LTAADIAQSEDVLNSSAVVLTQLEIPVDAAWAALVRGRQRGAATILNPAPVRPLPQSLLQMVDVLTPNEVEAKVLTGRSPEAPADPGEIARELIRSGVKQVVITLGEKGALIVTASYSKHIPAITVPAVVDTTGAGDAFNAGLATAFAYGAGLDAAVQFAVVTGGLAVTKEGVIPSLPRRAEVAHFYQQLAIRPPDWFSADR